LGLPAFYATAEGRLASVNTAFAALAGLDRESAGRTPLDALCADEQAARTWLAYAGGEVGEVNLNLRFANGTSRAAHVRRDPGRPPEQRFLGLVTEAATEINVVTAGGRDAAVQEMEDVALVFSHDLKEPLQQIMRIARRLEQRGRSTPGEDERLVGKLFTCADRASAMVDAMVEYLAVSSRDEPTDLVDLNLCLEEALGNLRASIDESEADVVAEQLPSIAGDAYQLVHLFQNIIANAIKFRGRERPELRISATTSDRFWRLVFRDNGIGIAAPFRESVFEIGKRLHTRDEYPGSGIGLTMCRRICERHGGSIHIEPQEGGGTAVVVEIPRTPSHITRLA
ncbi:MAG: sensor histidine kinase, partial [Gammaproteobacteria bacterium]